MLAYIGKRFIIMLPTMMLIMAVGFFIMQLPANDYVSRYVVQQGQMGNTTAALQEDMMRQQFGLDKPPVERFVVWVGNFMRGDLGKSFVDSRPVTTIIMERLPMTLAVSLMAFVASWGIGIPLGVYSATHQYKVGDVALTTISFIGIGLPDFLLALLFLVLAFLASGEVLLGLNSSQYINQPWSLERLADFFSHAWLSVTAVAFTGMAVIMRVTRNNMLEELGKNYVTTLRAKGLPERMVIWKHVFRNALHPLVTMFGQVLAFLINGFAITSAVLNLPTIQSTYLTATMQQDVFLSGGILIFIALTVMLGNLLSDILLAWLDPRVRYD